MKSLNCKVTVANVGLYLNDEGRQMISLVINEQIPARRFDKTTGEYVQTFANDIKMPLRQFGHIIFFETATMMQYYLAPKERSYYKETMSQEEYYNLLVGATLDVKIERFEDGETFINEIDGEEMTSDGVTFHTRINDIVLSKFGNCFGFGKPTNMDDMMAIIEAASRARGKKFDFAADKADATTAK